MSANSLTMFRGDVFTVVFAMTITENGVTRPLTALELTGVTIRFTAKKNKADPDSAAIVALSSPDNGVTIDPANSKCTVTIQPDATANLPAIGAGLDYDLQLTDSDSKPHTLTVSRLNIDGDVRRAI